MWEFGTETIEGREYNFEILREFSTDSRHIEGAWIATLKIMRDKEVVYYYRMGYVIDKMDDLDRERYQEIIAVYN